MPHHGDMTTTFTRVGQGMRSDTCYGVTVDSVFLGYVMGRDGLWASQPESDPQVPAEPTYNVVYHGPSRTNAVDDLVMEARQAGLLPAQESSLLQAAQDSGHLIIHHVK